MELFALREQNPYWMNPQAIEQDFHLGKIKAGAIEIINPVEKNIKINKDGIYIIRGPRQVGKTTLLKRKIKDLIKNGVNPERILYFAFDIGGLKNEQAVHDLIKTYIQWIRRTIKERVWIFLDEVTYTGGWALGLKTAFDSGLLEKVTCIATGSSCIDLKRGGERLPGRRGDIKAASDLIMLPINFRSFLKIYYLSKDREIPHIASFKNKQLKESAHEISLYEKELKEAFENYLMLGGYPLPLNQYFQKSRVENDSYYTYLQALLGDIARLGKSEMYFREIASIIISKKFEPIDWLTISQSTSIGSHSTVQSYVEDLSNLFVFDIHHHYRFLGGIQLSFKKRRKIYCTNSFIFHILNGWCAGTFNYFQYSTRWLENPENKAKLVENVAISHLKNLFPHSGFWRNEQEIDFIANAEKSNPLYIEIKYQSHIISHDKKSLKKVGGGIILSKDTLSFDKDNNILIIPVSSFLALLP